MKKNAIIVIALIVVVLLAGGWWFLQKKTPGGLPNPEIAANKNATQIIHFEAKIPAGDPKAGDCWGSSVVAPGRNDAWQCNIGDDEYTYDPCFSVAAQDTVVCNADPLSGSDGFSVLLKKPLPAPMVATAPAAWGWLLQLGDGTVCAPFTSTRGQVNGKTTTYGCKRLQGTANTVILGDLDSSKALWTAQVATISFGNNKITADKVETLSIAKAWQ